MENIVIEGSNHSPFIDFGANGKLKIEGRSIPEDINRLFNPLNEFVSKLEAKEVVLDINLEYFNTATSKKLLELMRCIESNSKIDNILINWHYEEGDDDGYEMGEIYEECMTRAKFKYFECADSTLHQ